MGRLEARETQMSHEVEPSEPKPRKGCLRAISALLVLGVAAVLLARLFVVQRITVPEGAMHMFPALQPGSPAWIDKLSHRISSPRRGDIVAVAAPGETEGFVILRIVALPGETVEAKDGALFVDGAPLAESYVRGDLPFSFEPQRVPRRHYFVLADDRGAYADEGLRRGAVREDDLIGRVLPASR